MDFPDFTLPPINLYVMAQLKHEGTYLKPSAVRKEFKPVDIDRLVSMRKRG